MDDQLELWTATTPDVDGRPRCACCARPARHRRDGSIDICCGGGSCTNRIRICQACSTTFTIGANGAGTKYCSTDCKRIGYQPTSTPHPHCAWCGQEAQDRGRRTTWPYICNTCTEPIRHLLTRLKDHHVPHERVRRLLTDPGCEICGIDIVVKRKDPTTQKVRALLVVDHDHDCCSGTHSCGRCVRGLICTMCNVALGSARNDTATLAAMITYLNVYGNDDDA